MKFKQSHYTHAICNLAQNKHITEWNNKIVFTDSLASVEKTNKFPLIVVYAIEWNVPTRLNFL